MKKKLSITLCIIIIVVLIGILSFIAIYRKTHSVLPKEINSIAIKYHSNNGEKTIYLVGDYYNKVSKELNSVLAYPQNFSAKWCGPYLYEIILNDDYNILIDGCNKNTGSAGYINDNKRKYVYISKKIENLVKEIVKENNISD